MLFRRKKKKEDLRRHYRTVPGKKHALSASLELAGRTPVKAQLLDVSGGGAGLGFPVEGAPELAPGSEVLLGFQSFTLNHSIRAKGPRRVG